MVQTNTVRQTGAAVRSGAGIEVFYDGGCPICRLEVNYYTRLHRADAIEWIDITALTDAQLPAAKSRDDLLGRFHVRDHTGDTWHIGVDAFARIWRELPVWRRFAFLFSVPGLRGLAELGYRGFLRWQRWHRARRSEPDRNADRGDHVRRSGRTASVLGDQVARRNER